MRWLLVGFLLTLAAAADAATLRVSCTAPIWDNVGGCATPALIAPASDSLWIQFEVSPLGIRDSAAAPRGGKVVRSWQVAAGMYQVRVWAVKRLASGAAIVGCDTTAALRAEETAAPHKVRLNP